MFRKQKPTGIAEKLDRSIATKDSAALFISGLGLSIAYLGYESEVKAVGIMGAVIFCTSIMIESSALDERKSRREYAEDGVEQLIQYSYSQDSVD